MVSPSTSIPSDRKLYLRTLSDYVDSFWSMNFEPKYVEFFMCCIMFCIFGYHIIGALPKIYNEACVESYDHQIFCIIRIYKYGQTLILYPQRRRIWRYRFD